jgi:hypothetical protein
VLAAWTYLALFLDHRGLAKLISPIVFIAGFLGVLWYDQFWSQKLYNQYESRKSEQGGTEACKTVHAGE